MSLYSQSRVIVFRYWAEEEKGSSCLTMYTFHMCLLGKFKLSAAPHGAFI